MQKTLDASIISDAENIDDDSSGLLDQTVLFRNSYKESYSRNQIPEQKEFKQTDYLHVHSFHL